MNEGNGQFGELNRLILEFEEDNRTIKADRLVMKNYPKVFTMSIASTFEHHIKNHCKNFLDNPFLPIASYPKILLLRSRKPIADQMFAKLEGYELDGVDYLNAQKFYELFGGISFKNLVLGNFSEIKAEELNSVQLKIDRLSNLVGIGEQYDYDYAKQCDLKDQLEICSFEDAEKSYLSLKLRRNRVAHDYINGLSDTFEDIYKFYNMAILYVIALEKAICSLTRTTM